MPKSQRILFFAGAAGLLLVVFMLTKGAPSPTADTSVVLFSALLMIAFVTLLLEHFFTRPTDVLAAAISILLLMAPLHNQLSKMGNWYWIFFYYNLALVFVALTSLLLLDGEKPATDVRNRASVLLKTVAVSFGNGRWLFFALFFLTLIFYVDSQSRNFLILSAYCAALLLIDPKRALGRLRTSASTHGSDIGVIIGVQSKSMFLAKLYRSRLGVRRYDLVEFRYSMDESNRVLKGLIVDNYLLNEQQWIKILCSDQVRAAIGDRPDVGDRETNVVYKLPQGEEPALLKRLAGLVVDGTTIAKLRFEYSNRVPIEEGTLLEVTIGPSKILYQVAQGVTATEILESRNETGFIVGEAVQLGRWNPSRLCFERFGWIPEVNAPVFTAEDIPPVETPKGSVLLGHVPNTNYPVLLDELSAITHHTAVLGVTGCGKSVFARDLIRRFVATGTKVVCVDFTNEYRVRLKDLKAEGIVPKDIEEKVFEAISAIGREMDEWPNKRDQEAIEQNTTVVDDAVSGAIKSFLASERKVALLDLPDVANTTNILEYTRRFFRCLFEIARTETLGSRFCVVLEEAHTVIPEWNFLGIEEKKAQALVNSIGQIALQGRKYGIGFFVIAQRTANVSKTVLTQCNTVVAFQQYDETSAKFLANYMGADMVRTLATLKPRQAIAVGKAFPGGIPLIFEVPEIVEPTEEAVGKSAEPADA